MELLSLNPTQLFVPFRPSGGVGPPPPLTPVPGNQRHDVSKLLPAERWAAVPARWVPGKTLPPARLPSRPTRHNVTERRVCFGVRWTWTLLLRVTLNRALPMDCGDVRHHLQGLRPQRGEPDPHSPATARLPRPTHAHPKLHSVPPAFLLWARPQDDSSVQCWSPTAVQCGLFVLLVDTGVLLSGIVEQPGVVSPNAGAPFLSPPGRQSLRATASVVENRGLPTSRQTS